MKKVIFISGAYRSKTEWGVELNIRKAEAAAIKLWKQGWVVICPHMNAANLDDECPDEVWLDGCLELLRRSDAIYMLSNWTTSAGAVEEHRQAIIAGKEIIYEDSSDFE